MDHLFIARTLCDLTRTELWEPRKTWALKRDPTVQLTIKVGRGNATYVRHSNSLKGPMTLVYGPKMVVSKADPARLGGWLSSREIAQRRYFDGEITMLNALAHTVIHEFGHVVQVLMGHRYSNGVHNDAFYQILDKAHRGGHADRIRTLLNERCLTQGMDLSSISSQPRRGSGMIMEDFDLGDEVYLRGRSEEHNPLEVVEKKRKFIIIKSKTTSARLRATPDLLYEEA